MAYIKERGNNNYFVRVSCGILDNGRPFQKSRLFRPSRVNLPESKVRKELDAFVKALEEECRIEFETKRQPQTNFELIQKQPLKCVNAQPEPDGQSDCHNRRKKQSDCFICPKPLLLHSLVQQKPDSGGDRCHKDDHQNQPDGIFCDHIFLDEGFHKGCSTGVTIGIVGFIYMVFLLSERCGGDAGTSPLCGYAINPRN